MFNVDQSESDTYTVPSNCSEIISEVCGVNSCNISVRYVPHDSEIVADCSLSGEDTMMQPELCGSELLYQHFLLL